MSPVLSVVAALALARQCAPDVASETIVGIAKTESGLRALSVHDNTSGLRYAPETPDAAIALATSLIVAQHHNVDLGLMQVNSANLAAFSLSVPDAFDTCRSMQVGARILSGAFHRALRAALSAYNTGDPQRGITNGYVARVEAATAAVPTGVTLAPTGSAPTPTTGVARGWDVFAQSGGTPFVFSSNGATTHAR